MVRKQLYLEPRQNELLKRRARERGVTEAHVLRDAIEGPGYAARGSRAPADPEAGQALLAAIRSLTSRRAAGRSRRTWTRDSLYEDRIGRWPKS